MYYYLYQITNLVNNKIYVGVHKTKSLDDGYMGSGKVIKRAIEKHGLENFRKDILEFFNTSEEMYAKEKEVVSEEFLLREDVYNLRRGGHGGWDYINAQEELRIAKNKKAGLKTGTSNLRNAAAKRTFKERSEIAKKGVETKKKNGNFEKYIQNYLISMNSEKAKEKRKETFVKIEHQQGEKNSQFGKMWIYNIETLESLRIHKDEFIPNGWAKGRKMKSVY